MSLSLQNKNDIKNKRIMFFYLSLDILTILTKRKKIDNLN
jgi:hypothetical protein